ncbi:DUF2804 domain-containing protein [Desulfosudis oleivorans]|uniref:DUF2804 domain-containing protein n=1 Tax=Desulfosudis oleivorans (strain DSM 6200 / JCM 39069 / Hxd3) TaxID=96561 RepID=A8ZX03_DESOH|nr:DUF2804 domain-containing protein [Desulfosudis oleivorans]ABW66859.1 conserved hypothetical protein [Desulfosudis oleivorans Hxd3]
MNKLVNSRGTIDFGVMEDPVEQINYLDYDLRTPMGRSRSILARKMLFKQFSFAGIDTPDVCVGMAVVDLKYAANAFFYVYDKAGREMVETKQTSLPFFVHIPTEPETGRAVFESRRLAIRISPERIFAETADARIDARLCGEKVAPLRICTRTGFRGWTFTRKAASVPVSGTLCVKGRNHVLAPESALAVTDWTAGYLRRHTFWNWAAAAALLPDGRRFGMNLSCGVNETEATENVLWVDGLQTKVDHVRFRYDQRNVDRPWQVVSADGKVDLTFSSVAARSEHLNVLAVASRFTQFIGTFSGHVTDDRQGRIELSGCPGWTEEHYAKW